MNSEYLISTRLIMGADCLKNRAESMAALGKKALIVTGKTSAEKCGALSDVIFALEKNGQKYEIYNKIMSNPTVECVYEGARTLRETGADFVVGIGGGSPMDAAKAIAVLAVTDIPRGELFEANRVEKMLPAVMVPTTAGTGSEVTQYAILTDEARQNKVSLSSPKMFPTLAYLDGKYLAHLPAGVIKNTAADALSHLIEGYLSRRANPVTDAIAREGLRMLSEKLPLLYPLGSGADLSPDDRDVLLYASTLAGMVIAHTATVAPHAMGYPLTYHKNIDHGRANGLVFAAFLEIAAKKAPQRMGEILRAMNFADLKQFSECMDKLLGEKEKITESEILAYAEISSAAKNIPNCIFDISKSEIEEIYRRSFKRG